MYRLTVVYDEPADKEAFDRRYTDEHLPDALKPHLGMGDMKSDMAGAAVVLNTVLALAELGLPADRTKMLVYTLMLLPLWELQDRVVGHACEPFRHAHVLARSSKRALAVEVCRLDNQRVVSIPVANRVSVPSGVRSALGARILGKWPAIHPDRPRALGDLPVHLDRDEPLRVGIALLPEPVVSTAVQ